MDLLIVRHAIAFERDRHRWRDDGARPLSPAGLRRARKAAAGLKEFSKAPDRLLTSPLVRARQTAQILTDVAGWPQAEEAPELSPGAAVPTVLALLGRDRSKLVAVVGHQPGLGHLLTVCLLGEGGTLPIEMKKMRLPAFRLRARHALDAALSSGSQHHACSAGFGTADAASAGALAHVTDSTRSNCDSRYSCCMTKKTEPVDDLLDALVWMRRELQTSIGQELVKNSSVQHNRLNEHDVLISKSGYAQG